MSDESILEEAQRIIHGARNVAYGHPRDNFAAIAALWNGYLTAMGERKEFSPQDVANLMILMKVGRVCNDNWHRDSYTDIAGYAGTAERMQEPIEEVNEGTPVIHTPERQPRVWDTWDYLNSTRVLADTEAGTKVRNRHGVIWTLHDSAFTADCYGRNAWLWSTDSKTEHSITGTLRDGPFTEEIA